MLGEAALFLGNRGPLRDTVQSAGLALAERRVDPASARAMGRYPGEHGCIFEQSAGYVAARAAGPELAGGARSLRENLQGIVGEHARDGAT